VKYRRFFLQDNDIRPNVVFLFFNGKKNLKPNLEKKGE